MDADVEERELGSEDRRDMDAWKNCFEREDYKEQKNLLSIYRSRKGRSERITNI